MIKVRNLGLLLALSSVAALPACSMFGGGSSSSRTSTPSQTYASAPQPNYSNSSSMQQADQPLTPDTVREVQQTLKQDGMYHSRVDGVWGPASQAALRDYQQQHNMNATGQLDQQTLASLNLGNNNGPNYSSSSQYTPQSSNAGSPNYGSANQNPNNQGAQPMSPGTPGQRAQNAQSNQQGGSSTH